ncbi:MAG TPA: CRISPR-associated ring nuclease Crn3/Csx3 [Methanothrix sp.]|nr:CRISPR-associated ring nuclease Crn3/Csx3 [Euryarchaeota archaeon]HON36289.1 CRISPR-associated ring nuclease Crn3/Csx3 [Methanothrix sp.]HRU76585.1 CRISPR-associated ring nuclease Crn3/Csx3 [Methanothrix sp.]
MPAILRGSLVVVEGRAPIWRYGMALNLLHGSPAAAIAFYDPRLGAVVVATHSPEWKVGQVVDVTSACREIARCSSNCEKACSSTRPVWRILASIYQDPMTAHALQSKPPRR